MHSWQANLSVISGRRKEIISALHVPLWARHTVSNTTKCEKAQTGKVVQIGGSGTWWRARLLWKKYSAVTQAPMENISKLRSLGFGGGHVFCDKNNLCK